MFKDYRQYLGSRPDKHYKTTLFQADRQMVGLNCLEPGQVQPAHVHAEADKFYFVIEGEGYFVVGTDERQCGPGTIVWAPAGVLHSVENRGADRLTLLVGIAPPPK